MDKAVDEEEAPVNLCLLPQFSLPSLPSLIKQLPLSPAGGKAEAEGLEQAWALAMLLHQHLRQLNHLILAENPFSQPKMERKPSMIPSSLPLRNARLFPKTLRIPIFLPAS